jgi:hypothetical protein
LFQQIVLESVLKILFPHPSPHPSLLPEGEGARNSKESSFLLPAKRLGEGVAERRMRASQREVLSFLTFQTASKILTRFSPAFHAPLSKNNPARETKSPVQGFFLPRLVLRKQACEQGVALRAG